MLEERIEHFKKVREEYVEKKIEKNEEEKKE